MKIAVKAWLKKLGIVFQTNVKIICEACMLLNVSKCAPPGTEDLIILQFMLPSDEIFFPFLLFYSRVSPDKRRILKGKHLKFNI